MVKYIHFFNGNKLYINYIFNSSKLKLDLNNFFSLSTAQLILFKHAYHYTCYSEPFKR